MRKLFFVLAACITSSQLWSQDSLPSAKVVEPSVSYYTGKYLEKVLDPVLVSANKYLNKTSLTGKVVIVITRDQLEKAAGKDLSQLLTEQAGVYIGGANSNAGKDKSLYLRGGRIDHTLITIDGVPVYDPSGIGGNFDIRNLALANIERIEILKGSQSTLYGSDAIAGVINIYTRKASNKPVSGNIGTSYGSNETFRGNAGVVGKAGVVDYNAGLAIHTTKGINEAINNGNFSVTDRDKFQQQSAQAGLGIRPTKNIYIQPFFRYNHSEGDLDQGAFTDELDYTFTEKSWQAGLRNVFNIGNTKLNLIYSYNNIAREYIDDSTESRNGFDTWVKGDYKGSEHFVEAFAIIPVTEQIKLTGGVDYRSSKSDQVYSSIGFFGPYETKNTNDSLRQNQFAIYAALNWDHPSGFNAELGGRVNFHSEYGSHAVYNFNPSWLISKKVKIFANLSSGYRTPSLYQLFSEYGNRDLKPEAATSIEGGIQYFSKDEKFMARAVGFARDVKDVIFFFYNPVTFTSQYINQDKQKDHGFELEASYRPSGKISIKSSYTYVTGEIHTKKGTRDTVYNNLIRRPKGSFTLNLTAQVTKKLNLSSTLLCFGERKDAYFDATTFNTVNVTLDSYVLWDIYADYSFLKNKLKVFVDLRNITSTKYNETAGFNTLGFNMTGGIRFNF